MFRRVEVPKGGLKHGSCSVGMRGDNGRIIDGRIIFLEKKSEKILGRCKMHRQRPVARRHSYDAPMNGLIFCALSVRSILLWKIRVNPRNPRLETF
jgi:hypothetical protein